MCLKYMTSSEIGSYFTPLVCNSGQQQFLQSSVSLLDHPDQPVIKGFSFLLFRFLLDGFWLLEEAMSTQIKKISLKVCMYICT